MVSLSAKAYAAMSSALANANVMFFRSAYNVQVIVDENDHGEKLLGTGRFRREVMRAGIIQECNRRKFLENNQEEKKRRTRDDAKRNKKRGHLDPAVAEAADATKEKKDSGDRDNWDLPEGAVREMSCLIRQDLLGIFLYHAIARPAFRQLDSPV